MIINGTKINLFDVGKIAGIVVILGTLGLWYKGYADNSAKTGAAIGTNIEEIRELKIDMACQKQVNAEQERIMVRLEEFYKLTAPRSYDLAAQRADSVIRAREDSINTLKNNLKKDTIP
jgi:hypothetical protein